MTKINGDPVRLTETYIAKLREMGAIDDRQVNVSVSYADTEAVAKAAHYDHLAETVGDRELIRYYRGKARELRKKAAG